VRCSRPEVPNPARLDGEIFDKDYKTRNEFSGEYSRGRATSRCPRAASCPKPLHRIMREEYDAVKIVKMFADDDSGATARS
jgi:hypothetical protein